MARPIRIPFVSDVRDFLKGTKNIGDALDDVADALDDVAKDAADSGREAGDDLADGFQRGADDVIRKAADAGDEAGRKFAQGLADGRPFDEVKDEFERAATAMVREAETASERMERSFKDAMDGAGRDSSTKLLGIGDDAKRGFDKASEGADHFRDESDETAREVAASFDGSAESIADGFQEVAANAFAGFGPAGAAAGLAAAAGIGFITKAWQGAKEAEQEAREGSAELAGQFVEDGSAASQSIASIAENLRELATVSEEGKFNLAEWRELAEDLGLAWTDVARAIGGDMEANASVLDDLKRREEELVKIREREIALSDDASARRTTNTETELDQNRQTQEELGKLQEQWDNARAQEQAYYDAGLAAAPGQQEIIRDLAEDVVALSGEWSEAFDKITEDGKITSEELNASLDQMLADQDAKIRAYTWAQRHLTEEQMLALEAFGEDRAAVIETLMNTPPNLRQETLQKLQRIGERKGQAETQGIIDGMPREIEGPTVRLRTDRGEFDRAIGSLPKRVYVDVVPRNRFQDQLN